MDTNTRRDELIKRIAGMRSSTLGYIRVLVRDAHLAEDVFQETWLVLLRKLDEYDRGRDLGAYVRGIARNVARNLSRKEGRMRTMPSPELMEAIDRAHDAAPAEESEELASMMETLHLCLERLSDTQSRLVEMRYGAGRRMNEIAKVTGRSAVAVQVALTRIRQFLLDCMRKAQESENVAETA